MICEIIYVKNVIAKVTLPVVDLSTWLYDPPTEKHIIIGCCCVGVVMGVAYFYPREWFNYSE